MEIIYFIGLAAIILVLASIRQINQYEKGVKFTLGRYSGVMDPGWRLVIPVFQTYQKVDLRVKAVDVPHQEAITKDNISVTVNAVIYYKVRSADKAIIEVENFYYATSQLAQTTMRNVVGEVNLDELLSGREAIAEGPIDLALGGWGQDGHVAYNQSRRHPFLPVGLEELAASTIRVQENNLDTILALAHRTFGAAYQFVPPMSVTLGMKECLSASKVRVFSDTGSWKQTALRVALFSEPVPEYPMTLLQRHPDALVTATMETARHPISEHPEWELL